LKDGDYNIRPQREGVFSKEIGVECFGAKFIRMSLGGKLGGGEGGGDCTGLAFSHQMGMVLESALGRNQVDLGKIICKL